LIAAPAAGFGSLTSLIAALAMSSSSLIVTLNALRLQVSKAIAFMNIMVVLIPGALCLGALGLAVFFWCLKSGQYEDLEGDARRILLDDED
jgi:cbb3-type cytochrome oxidase maturation protein